MMRSKPASSMQKTYDECYLICSTAVFFEGQNNESEALRSWRSALDQIYYHNAYRLPSSYVPKSETERALFDSLKQLEIQCKERVDLLEALKRSRKEAEKEDKTSSARNRLGKGKSVESLPERSSGWLGDETVPPMQLSELPNATPALPPRPSLPTRLTSDATIKERAASVPQFNSSPFGAPPTLPVPNKQASRSPSPDHNRKAMRTTLRSEKRAVRPPKSAPNRKPAPMKAAGLAWDTQTRTSPQTGPRPDSDPTIEARLSATATRRSIDTDFPSKGGESRREDLLRMPDPQDYIPSSHWRDTSESSQTQTSLNQPMDSLRLDSTLAPPISAKDDLIDLDTPPIPPPHSYSHSPLPTVTKSRTRTPPRLPKPPEISYRREYPSQSSNVPASQARRVLDNAYQKSPADAKTAPGISRKPVGANNVDAKDRRRTSSRQQDANTTSESDGEVTKRTPERTRRAHAEQTNNSKAITPPSTDAESPAEDTPDVAWEKKAAKLLKDLPKGVDEGAAKQILNEIVVKGDEVHWDDVAGLDLAKKALKEAVVYPFLRPDLFMGLREPARGMLLFGPPGTGKTMLARAVATESKSTFFAISASSLTSKWHGESEKLVRALFALAKVLAPSIIFVDEIDSLLSARSGSSEHEASRRSKTEFLIQWSDLQRAAAGAKQDTTPGDPSRVLVLAATNCPWDIDDAARRRFVRRQYIPLPEAETREKQLRTLLGHQKHDLSAKDIWRLVGLTDGYSGSDITALAKDAAMGPLRNLGEALLYTPMDQIRPIHMGDFEASLESIRPSVSKKGLVEFEQWAREFGERGG